MSNETDPIEPKARPQLDFAQASRLIHAILADDDDAKASDWPQIEGYRIGKRLGAGAGGEVFMATHEGTSEAVAIKLLHRSIGTPKSDKRAWRELDILSELNIPGVPGVRDFGLSNNRMYVVTTHVEGLALDDYCAQRALDRNARVELLIQLAEIVQKLHEHGVIHRDLKPGNVIVQSNGKPVVIDFGIALLLGDGPRETLTQAGAPIGTVGFMAPEQARGEKGTISTRSDVFSLGAILCVLLTGQTPHAVSASFHESIRRIAQEQPRHPRQLDPTLPRSLAGIIQRATAAVADDRYASAAEFAADLRRWLNDEIIPWQRTNWIRKQFLSMRRNPRAFIAKAAVVVLVAATLVSSSLAYAQAQTAHQLRLSAAEQQQLREEAEKLSKAQTELAEKWKQAAEERDVYRAKVEENNRRLAELTQEQVDAIQLSLDQGLLYDASMELWAIGQEIEQLHPDDAGLLKIFVGHMTKVIEAAKAQHKGQ